MLRAIGKKYQETALIKLIAVGLVIGIVLAVAAPHTVPAVAIFVCAGVKGSCPDFGFCVSYECYGSEEW